jgi:ATPase subunit of ABC transporter with duplicated ATPase domains
MNYSFKQNKYSKWYFNIIKKRKILSFEGYAEIHHILPKSLGGTNEAENLVKLTAREHFICHLLLTKIVNGHDTYLMLSAVSWMVRTTDTRKNRYIPRASILYEFARNSYEKIRQDKTKKKISESLQRYYQENPERRSKISDSMSKIHTGRKKTDQHKQRIGDAHRNIPKSLEQREKIANSVSQHVKNTIWINDGRSNKRILAHEQIPTGYVRGRLMSQNHIQKMIINRTH